MTRAWAVALAALVTGCVDDVVVAREPLRTDAHVTPEVSADARADASDAVDEGLDVQTDLPVDVPTDLPVDVPMDTPVDVAVDLPVDVPPDVPPDAPASTFVYAVMTVTSDGPEMRSTTTDILVALTRGDAGVTSALVRLSSSLGSVTLEPVSGHFHAVQEGYASSYELTIATADDHPPPQRWTALPAHVITSPRPNEMHAPLTPLTVTWTPTGAMDAQFVSPMTSATMADTGAATLPGSLFPRDPRMVTLRLRRRATVTLPGFAPGSIVRTDLTASVPIIVQ